MPSRWVRSMPWLAQTPVPISAPFTSRPERRSHVGAVEGEDIHRIVHPVVPGQVDKTAGELIVVGPAGVLGADGDGILAARQIQPHAAHVHRDELVDVRRQGAGPVAYLFIDHKIDMGGMAELHPVLGAPAQQHQQHHGAGLVVNEPGLQEPGLGDSEFGVDKNEIAVLDPQGLYVFGGGHPLVQPDLHVLVVPGQGGGVREHVRSGGLG